MGYQKDRLIEDAESGLNASAADGKFVCADCFTDSSLQSVVERGIAHDVCTFCGAQSDEGIAAPLEFVMHHIVQCLRRHYDDPANCLPYESAEGGYQGETFDSWEVLDHAGIEDCLAEGREHLCDAIRDSLEDAAWCERDPFALRHHERLSFSWDGFCDFIKHTRRFFFLRDRPAYVDGDNGGDRLLDPGEMLRAITKHCLELGLVRSLSRETRAYRVRRQKGRQPFRSALDLGAPPPDVAVQSNRMSPPGVVMTYLAEDETTALKETADRGGHRYAIGEFAIATDVPVLDLTKVPPVPSIFDLGRFSDRDAILFLHQFTRDVSKPIARNDRVNVDYIPTQVMTEYIRDASELQAVGVRGLRYASARRRGGVCLVLFGGRELLELDENERNKLLPREREAASERATCLRLVRPYSLFYPGKCHGVTLSDGDWG